MWVGEKEVLKGMDVAKCWWGRYDEGANAVSFRGAVRKPASKRERGQMEWSGNPGFLYRSKRKTWYLPLTYFQEALALALSVFAIVAANRRKSRCEGDVLRGHDPFQSGCSFIWVISEGKLTPVIVYNKNISNHQRNNWGELFFFFIRFPFAIYMQTVL